VCGSREKWLHIDVDCIKDLERIAILRRSRVVLH
jgi:hypothetical protein